MHQFHLFSTPSKSLLKTIIISLTGEIEFEGIAFSSILSQLIFLLYVFFIMLVLVNLLNGLAVSDITEIQKHAEIVSYVSRVELISYIESMLLGDPFQFLTNFPAFKPAKKLPSCNFFSSIYKIQIIQKLFSIFGTKRFLLFSERLRNKTAVFLPNRSNQEKSTHGDKTDLLLTDKIIEDAKGLVVKKQTITEGDEVEIHDRVLISPLHISASLAPLATSQAFLPWLDC